MGYATDGVLAYGYALTGEGGWLVHEADDDGLLPPLDWYDEDEDAEGFDEAARIRLEEQLGKDFGVSVTTYCSNGEPYFLLTAADHVASRGDVVPLDLGLLHASAGSNRWDEKLEAALQALGLTPHQDQARWLLCSFTDRA